MTHHPQDRTGMMLATMSLHSLGFQMVYRLRADAAAQDHHDSLEQSMMQRAVEEDALREREKLERAHTKLAKAQAERANQQALWEADARRNLRTMHRDIRMEQVRYIICE